MYTNQCGVKGLAPSMIFFCLFMIFTTGLSWAEPGPIAEFHDGFEYSDSPANHGWSYIFSGDDNNFITTKEHAHSGARSLSGHSKNDSRVGLQFDCAKKGIGEELGAQDKFVLSVWFYDHYEEDKDERSSQFTHTLSYYEKSGYQGSVSLSANSYKYSFSEKILWKTFEVRSKGWHELKLAVENNKMDIYFDSLLVGKDIRSKVDKIGKYEWSSNIVSPDKPAFSWIDNVHVKYEKNP